MTFFISDTHFYATGKFDTSRFKDKFQKDKLIIKNWCSTVKEEDHVYVLGDFCDSNNLQDWEDVVSKLSGHIHLIKGNHEAADMPLEAEGLFEEVRDYAEVELSKDYPMVVLFHYPIIFYRYDRRPLTIQLHGHVHMDNEDKIIKLFKKIIKKENANPDSKDVGLGRLYNVGAMCPWMDYTSRTLDEIVNASINIEDYN